MENICFICNILYFQVLLYKYHKMNAKNFVYNTLKIQENACMDYNLDESY